MAARLLLAITLAMAAGAQKSDATAATAPLLATAVAPQHASAGNGKSVLGVSAQRTLRAEETLEFPACGVRVVKGRMPGTRSGGSYDFYRETGADTAIHKGKGIAFACCDADGTSNCDRHEFGDNNDAGCNVGKYNSHGSESVDWYEAMDHCGVDRRTLCDAFTLCTGTGCSYDSAYLWTDEECQPGDDEYQCTPQSSTTGHCDSMGNAGFAMAAVGYGYNAGSPYKNYWTQMFAYSTTGLDTTSC